jgi:TolB protein
MVQALDLGNQPVFSPSFAADGSAVFFDEQNEAGASALKEARTSSAGRAVQVLSVVADGARNYHPRLSPDGSQVAFDSDRDGVRGVYISDRAGRNIRRVSGAGYAAVPSWSPDGSRLAFVKAEPDKPRVWNIWILTLATGEATRITSYRYGQPWGASWLPDGRRICYSHEDRLIVLDLDTGESQTYTSPRKGALLRTPAVSPDGRRVIFQLHGDGAWMLDLANGKMQKVLDDPTAEEFAWSPDGRRVAFHSRRDKQWGIWVLRT